MTEYRLVVGVLGIVFDEESEAEAKRQFDLFVQNQKLTIRGSGNVSYVIQESRNHPGSITLLRLRALRPFLKNLKK